MNSILAELAKRPAKLDCLKDPAVLNLEGLTLTPFHMVALIIFGLAVLHTFSVHKIRSYARSLESTQAPKRLSNQERSLGIHLLYFLSEVEIVFVLWAIPLFLTITCFYGWKIALEYINTRDYTEPLFVVVTLAVASTRPILMAAQKLIQWAANGLGGSLAAWWFTLLTLGPLLGSLITEVGAMALSALLLSQQFYTHHPSKKLAYATIALLFVNISVGGTLTVFASPTILVLSHYWNWTLMEMLTDFGWKAVLGILISNTIYLCYFRKELKAMGIRQRALEAFHSFSVKKEEAPVPFWVTAAHILFLSWIVLVAHYPTIFIASFLLFLGFHRATRHHQSSIQLVRPLLVGLFLAGLLIHGGLQGWWVVAALKDLSPTAVFGTAIALTGFNDNTAIAYLATLIPEWGDIYEYAIFTGLIAGGGLTVIANAPNPAGYAILRKHFAQGIEPLKLLAGALMPTLILYLVFYLFSPLLQF